MNFFGTHRTPLTVRHKYIEKRIKKTEINKIFLQIFLRNWAQQKSSYNFTCNCLIFLWSHLGLNQGLPDYESGALTN